MINAYLTWNDTNHVIGDSRYEVRKDRLISSFERFLFAIDTFVEFHVQVFVLTRLDFVYMRSS